MHRPERWGFVQFSTAGPGQARSTLDPVNPIRDRLMAIYHAQTAYREKHKSWASTLEALGLGAEPKTAGTSPSQIKLTPSGFEASIAIDGPPPRVWTVREDSRLSRSDR
jgi:hypothetical protein